MDKINLLVIVTAVTLFISFFLAFFLVTVKTKHKLSNSLFAIFLIITGIDISEPIFNLMVQGPSNLGMWRNSIAFLQIPIFYLYVLSVCYSDFKFKPKHLLHLLPFLIANLILIPRFYSVDTASKISFLQNYQNMFELQFNHILIHITILGYIAAVFMILRKAKKLYLENHAGTSIKSYNWLFQFTVALTILYLIAFVKNVFKFSDYQHISEGIKIGLLLFQLLIICWYLYKALNNPSLFRNIDSKMQLVVDIVSEEQDQGKIDEDNKPYDDALVSLKAYMERDKPFLLPSITIQNISDEIGIPVRELSLMINHKLGQHFFDFINIHRIEYAKTILEDPTRSKVSILEILYEVGFNSKSSFNTAFKKHTGLTPTMYRKQLKHSDL